MRSKNLLERDLEEEIARLRREAEDTLNRASANQKWALVSLLERALEDLRRLYRRLS